MPISANVIQYVADSATDYYLNKGEALQQAMQARPLVAIMERKAKEFPSGKAGLSFAIQGARGANGVGDPAGGGTASATLKGYEGDDTVEFYNPNEMNRVAYDWKEHHIGLSVTHTELKQDGITVTDEAGKTAEKGGREATALVNLWENKLFDFGERYADSLNLLLWGDGTADPKALHGLQYFLLANPLAGTTGGIDRTTAIGEYFTNRARTAAYKTAFDASGKPASEEIRWGGDAVQYDVADGGALTQVLQYEKRQLIRYGGRPDVFLAGSDFIDAYEREQRANGNVQVRNYKGNQDGAMGSVLFDGTTIEYDPTLDDMGFAKRGYWFDSNKITLMKMQGEWRRNHNPARPHDKFVLRRSITSTGQMIAKQLNSSLVIDIK
ncbi:phage major capsid protein [uncultured Cohaesibacter sp.]|uniref:phage major capsid protein n=1 Tax=uncultured Cohaesibacter sp. TaxID=1002546 RepID=UPI0029C8F358|nr:phage major capsid protein [uncultured Cohaesibacter sp.]